MYISILFNLLNIVTEDEFGKWKEIFDTIGTSVLSKAESLCIHKLNVFELSPTRIMKNGMQHYGMATRKQHPAEMMI